MISILVESQINDGTKQITMRVGESEPVPLVFDALVKLSQAVLEAKIQGKTEEYKTICNETWLQPYCDTISGIISDVLVDTDLQKVYKDNSALTDSDSASTENVQTTQKPE